MINYFNKRSLQYIHIYNNSLRLKSFYSKIRWYPLYYYFQTTMRLCENLPKGTVLDIGCGTANYSIALAQMGYSVTALDIAPGMIQAGKNICRQTGVSVEFHYTDFMSWKNNIKFDLVLLIGVLDYVDDPTQWIQVIHTKANAVIVSLPKKNFLSSILQIKNKFNGLKYNTFTDIEITSLFSKYSTVEILSSFASGYLVFAHHRKGGTV